MMSTPSFPDTCEVMSSERGVSPTFGQHYGTATPSGEAEVKPISERQFEAAVRGFDQVRTPHGIRYRKEGQRWEFIREGNRVMVRHGEHPRPQRYYELV